MAKLGICVSANRNTRNYRNGEAGNAQRVPIGRAWLIGTISLLNGAFSGAAVTSDAPAIQPTEPLSFEQRCADPKVVLCDPLDDGDARGAGIDRSTKNKTLTQALAGKYRDWRWCRRVAGVSPSTPVMDRDIKASGSGSVRFTIPSESGAGAPGYCQINFTPDNSVQFGEGESFFVQFRVRMSCSLLYMDCDSRSPNYKRERRSFRAKQGITAIKVSIINAGDHPQLKFPVNSCTDQELVLLVDRDGAVTGYHSCGWYDGHAFFLGAHRGSGNGITDRQPIRKNKTDGVRGCFNIDPKSGRKLTSAWEDCIQWEPDEWLTVTQQVSIGRWTTNLRDPGRSSNIRVWVARAGQEPTLVIDYDRNLRQPEEPFMKYGKVWLIPYMTGKDPSEIHPNAQVWFDELIVSRGPIAPAK